MQNKFVITPADYIQWKNHPVTKCLFMQCRNQIINAQIAMTDKGKLASLDTDLYMRWLAETHGYIDAFRQILEVFKIEEEITLVEEPEV